jgi:diadenosine tetraphosphate (Ap4A) HIT family hydrolase
MPGERFPSGANQGEIERVFFLPHCVFCQRLAEEVITENDLAAVMIDNYPVARGHLLVVPKRHVESFFEATLEEINAITQLIFGVKERLDQQFHPDGYNIGVNVGKAAGQGVFHLHVHVIPRYSGDVSDPKGGIRRILIS